MTAADFEATSYPRNQTLNEDITLYQLVTAPLQKHTVELNLR